VCTRCRRDFVTSITTTLSFSLRRSPRDVLDARADGGQKHRAAVMLGLDVERDAEEGLDHPQCLHGARSELP